jgi:acetolactate synthase-1/2/3 large subunit
MASAQSDEQDLRAESERQPRYHGGRLVARRLKAHGLGPLFTLSGGHLFSIYDGCVKEEIPIVDVRHEATAAFAAEGHAKVTRTLGVCALTAGPGVTNGISALASAQANHSPLLALGGRAPAMRWGQGSLQEIDHVPFVRPLTKLSRTIEATEEVPELIEEAIATALAPHGGPTFLDFPLDYVFMEAAETQASAKSPLHDPHATPQSSDIERAAELLRAAERPVVMAGSDLYWGHGERALLALVEELRIPVYLNGLARGCIAADHELYRSRTRSSALKQADVALLVGVPMDFRLGFGGAFGDQTEIIAIDVAEPQRPHSRAVAAELYGPLEQTFAALRASAGPGALASERWIAELAEAEREAREGERAGLADARAPLHPMRIYAELSPMLERDAIVICDGGDFVSYAGRLIDSYEPGCWLDPGPFGCLGTGPGYALAAALARPGRQIVLLLGDGAFGFSGMEFDTLIRHRAKVVAVMGNNGIWGLEKHPMEFVYGYSVAADLRPAVRYDEVVRALGGHGELVERPDQLRGALERAFSADQPALVNVLSDPSIAYPRKANLA